MLGGDPLMDETARREILRRIEILEETDPDSAQIEVLKDYLRGSTFKGKTKGFSGDNEKARMPWTGCSAASRNPYCWTN